MSDAHSGLPDEFLRALGLITVNFSYLEYMIAVHCGVLISAKIPGTGWVITSEMSVKNLLGLLSSLFKNAFRNPEVQEELKDLLKRIDDCCTQRNLVTHSIWTPEFDFVKEIKGEVIRRIKYTAKRKKGLDVQWENYSPDDLHQIANSIREVTEDLKSFMESLCVALQFADTSDAGKEYPMEIEPFTDENTGKVFYLPKESQREKELSKNIEAYIAKLREERKAALEE
jgi:hypothetical protein